MKPGIQNHLYREEKKKLVSSYVEELKKEAKIETFF